MTCDSNINMRETVNFEKKQTLKKSRCNKEREQIDLEMEETALYSSQYYVTKFVLSGCRLYFKSLF